jgi:hypothetical protein
MKKRKRTTQSGELKAINLGSWEVLRFTLCALSFALLLTDSAQATTPWEGILDPNRAIDWSTAGIPGGIPVRNTNCAAIAASACGNGSADCTSTIQNALNGCASGEVVSLGAGYFLLNGVLNIPGNVTLRGRGADQTILSIKSTSGSAAITMGTWTVPWNMAGNVSIVGGATAGSQSIVVSDASGIMVGGYLLITELNDPSFVSIAGDEGSCTWCGPFNDNGSRVLGQVSEVTSVAGTTIGINPGLFRSMNNPLPDWSPNTSYPLNAFINPSAQPAHSYQQTVENSAVPYTCTSASSVPAFPTDGTSVTDGTCAWLDIGPSTTTLPLADPFSATKYAGIENLQIYANNTGAGASIAMTQCAYCWISGVENNYTDGDHVDVTLGYHDEIVNSYFSNAFLHTPGGFDSDIDLRTDSTGVLVQNNIIERNHVSVMLEWGAAGNVIAYNYMFGNFGNPPNHALFGTYSMHGAHPEFNLSEGNIGDTYSPDGIWGSNSHNTSFREWQKGTTKLCSPFSGRGVVSCSPTGVQGDPGVNGWWATQQIWPFGLGIASSYYNLVGGILGSQDMANLTLYDEGTPMAQTNEAVAVCGPSPCGPGSRPYDSQAIALTLGYWGADDGSSPYGTLTPYSTLFEHGEYTSPSGMTTWSGSVTQALPASFYLSSKPSWFGSVPFPAIGPDVSGGLDNAFGHAYAIPAEICYEQVMGGTDGTGSPLRFNADVCYAGASYQPPPNGLPQTLTLDFGDVLPVNATLGVSYNPGPGYSNLTYVWTITPLDNSQPSDLSRQQTLKAGAISSSVSSQTSVPALGLTTWSLAPGPYTISVYATDGTTNSNTASKTITLVLADLSQVQVYPNPWRSDKHTGKSVTFANLSATTSVKIFTVSGHLAKDLGTANGTVTWDLTNDSGDKVASGIYLYLITDSQGDKVRGKVGVIR